MRVIVQKFGGPALATAERRARAAAWVRAARREGLAVVAVVSAPGRRGDPYATDTLLDLWQAELGDAGGDPWATEPRALDLLLGCGELIAAALFTATLLRHGVTARALSGPEAGLRTDGRHGRARVVAVDPEPLRRALAEAGCAVVAGFQGAGPDGSLTTLGRGASDLTAAVLAAALGAERIELYKDVDGVRAADPRLDPGAPRLDRLDYAGLRALVRAGARIVHPEAVEVAAAAGVPLWVRDLDGRGPGTWIGPAAGAPPSAAAPAAGAPSAATAGSP